MSDELGRLADDLLKASATVTKRVRGSGAKVVDAAAKTAQSIALSSWTRYGHGMAGAAGTIRGRMSADPKKAEGYIVADGLGAHQSEYGTTEHAPAPAMSPAVDMHEAAWTEAVVDAGSDIL